MRIALRAGLALLTLIELTLGVFTQLFPREFYDTVPTVNLDPPFNEHLMRDFGGATLGLAVVLAAATWIMDKRLVTVALLAFLVFSATHLAFHVSHLEHLHGAESVMLTTALAVLALVPVLLLVLTALQPRPAPAKRGRARNATDG